MPNRQQRFTVGVADRQQLGSFMIELNKLSDDKFNFSIESAIMLDSILAKLHLTHSHLQPIYLIIKVPHRGVSRSISDGSGWVLGQHKFNYNCFKRMDFYEK